MTKNILVVDDEPEILEILSEIVQVVGHTPYPFTDPELAIEKYSTLSIDLIITDYMMPEINGEEMLFEIFSTNSRVPVIIVTGFEEELLLDSDPLAPVVITGKPFENDTIKQLIRIHLPS